MKHAIFTFLTFLLFTACSDTQNPETILSHKQMENILFDYHLAQSLANHNGDSIDFKTRLYTEAVFKKHNTTEEQFDNSLRYYHRHAEELHKIYKPLSERLNQLAGIAIEPQYTSEGDTANIWTGRMFYMLNSAYKSHLAINLPPDTVLQEGDKIELTFNPLWIYKDIPRHATAILTIEYEGDTISADVHNVTSTGPQQLNLRILNKKMTGINLYVLQNAPWSDLPQHLVLTNFSLIRYHDSNNTPAATSTQQQENNLTNNATFHFGNK